MWIVEKMTSPTVESKGKQRGETKCPICGSKTKCPIGFIRHVRKKHPEVIKQ